MSQHYDVAVVGLGGIGAAAVDRIAATGLRVLGVEQFGPIHDRGSSHGESRMIRRVYAEGDAYVPLVQRAYELWAETEQRSQQKILNLTGGLMIGRHDGTLMSAVTRSAATFDLDHEFMTAEEVRRRFPTLTPHIDDVAMFDPAAGFLCPETANRAHLDLATQSGATLRFHEPVHEWQADSSGVTVRTGRATYRVDRLVICPGAWAAHLIPRLAATSRIERQVQLWIRPARNRDLFRVDRQHPVFLWECADGAVFYGFPSHRPSPDLVKVARHHGGRMVSDPDQVDRRVRVADRDNIHALLEHRVPALAGPPCRAATCMYTNSADNQFVIGRHPDHDAVLVASCLSGHGYKFAPVIGEILAELALTDRTRHDISAFRPARPALMGSAAP